MGLPFVGIKQGRKSSFIFRWNDDACPGPSITSLNKLIDTKFAENPSLEKVVLLGHSYGGLLVAAFTDKWDKEIPLEAHAIAAPLKGMGALNNVCDYQIQYLSVLILLSMNGEQ